MVPILMSIILIIYSYLLISIGFISNMLLFSNKAPLSCSLLELFSALNKDITYSLTYLKEWFINLSNIINRFINTSNHIIINLNIIVLLNNLILIRHNRLKLSKTF